MQNSDNYIIDFDSTFVTLECLDELAAISLNKDPKKHDILEKINNITRLGMEGKITFSESLEKRLSLFKTNKEDIEKLIKLIKKHITPSVKNNKNFFKKYAQQIYIISGGFKEYILPITKTFGIPQNHVLANSFKFDKNDDVIGIDKNNLLALNSGKVKQVKKLKLKGTIYIIGDGYTDYQIKEKGQAEKFFAFTENIKRENIVSKADYISASFDEVLYRLKLPRALSFPKTMMKVLLLENIHPLAKKIFTDEGYMVETLPKALSPDELKEILPDISILGIRSKTAITADILTTSKKLHTIGIFAIGTNHVDMTACANKGIAVFNAPYSNSRSVVELTLGNIIMLYRKAFEKSQKLHLGVWDKSAKDCHEIRGKNLGIVGYGNIGSQLSVLAEGLGMNVFFYDIADKLAHGNAKPVKSLKELLKISDVVTIHVDGRLENTNLISDKEFKQMKTGVIFLNLSRGYIVDINALETNLKIGKVSAAAVDVFPREPKSDSEKFSSILQGLSNVILTPHIGAGTEEGQKNIAEFVPKKLINFINTGNTTLSNNFPNIQLPKLSDAHRFIHIHKNIPGVLAKINNIFAHNNINIEGQYLKTDDNLGYVITDVSKIYRQEVIHELKLIPETIKVRILY